MRKEKRFVFLVGQLVEATVDWVLAFFLACLRFNLDKDGVEVREEDIHSLLLLRVWGGGGILFSVLVVLRLYRVVVGNQQDRGEHTAG